ncbi:MAG TPA: DUF5655 domain-containing protein [Planctomycetota bacterium]|nr:DUF5655 domain-containing protein [Planctomycetota bacterium]
MPSTSAARGKNPYSVHPSIAMVEKWVAELPAKTGRSVEQWIALVKKDGPKGHAERREWLKTKHGLGSNAAWWIADRVEGKGMEDTPDGYLKTAPKWVDAMYAGPKAALRPIHDELVRVGLSLAPDVKACPCQTIVPLFRNHVIAQIKPSTRTRIDFGFALGDTKATGRLIDTGGFKKKDRITHRIEVASAKDIDAELKRWLRVAYDRDA